LIGGSLARALRQRAAVGEIVGAGRGEASLRRALDLGVIDRFSTDLPSAVNGADMVVVAVPLGGVGEVFAAIADTLPEECVLTDVGSAKGSVVAAAVRAFGRPPANFVPGHPIAGIEKSGVEVSFPELFRHRRVILTPLLETDAGAHRRVRHMWQATGAEVIDMGVEHHDEVLAATSHLPHMLAYALVDSLARMDDRAEIFRYAAGGFRDFTRIASSDPQMWHDICVANRKHLLEVMEHFSRDLDRLRLAVEDRDGEAIMDIFRRAKQARDNLYLD
jgi:prephenate dehydrogenase